MTNESKWRPKRYLYEPPLCVTAAQWLPDDSESATKLLRWLMIAGVPFRIEYAHGLTFLIIMRGGGNDVYVHPMEWVVRECAGAYAAWDADTFRANFRLMEQEEDGGVQAE